MVFANKMLNKAKYTRFMEEVNAEESSEPNVSVSVGQNETLPMEQNINIETDNVFKWPHEAILLLIEEYRKRTDDFYSGRISQKKNWQNIAEELLKNKHYVTGPQCQSKFNSLKRSYKSIKDHNGKSGNGSKTWAYYNLMDGLIGSKPCISPVATASSTGKRVYSTTEDSSVIATNANGHEQQKKKLNQMPSVDKVIFAIEENRKISEENKDKRHKEKLEQKKEALGLLARIVAVMEKKT
uniref:Myb/SANT-like DNA-binding domain-containing protein n=1 Tax=Schizaphis graminum TaxID=13262 RepID=A0A2S2P8L4_SCHGA